jgi:hypothetical protein
MVTDIAMGDLQARDFESQVLDEAGGKFPGHRPYRARRSVDVQDFHPPKVSARN